MNHQAQPGLGDRRILWKLILASLLLAWLAATPVLAQGVPGCTYTQLTDASADFVALDQAAIGNQLSSLIAWGGPFLFESFDIYLYDAQSGSFLPGPELGMFNAAWPAFSADDRVIALSSTGEPVGSNPDLSAEIFLYETDTGAWSQITDTPAPGVNTRSTLSGDGRTLAFSSNSDLVPGQNPDGDTRVFVYSVDTGQFRQVDAIPDALHWLVLSEDGSRLAVISFPGSDVPGATATLWLVEVETLAAEVVAMNLPWERDSSIDLDAVGNRVVFASEDDLVPGANPEGNREIFVYDAAIAGYLQITDTTDQVSHQPSLSSDGRTLAFTRDESVLLGLLEGGSFTEIAPGGDSWAPLLSADGQRVVFIADADLVGDNPERSAEGFLAECPELGLGDVTNIPTASGYGLMILALLLAGGATFLLRRRRVLVSLLLLCWVASPALAQGVPGCTYTQLTDASDGDLIGIGDVTVGNQRAALVAFAGPFDPMELDAYFFDAQSDDFIDGPDFVFPSPDDLAMSADDRFLAFVSTEDLIGSNPDFNQEIFLFEISTRTLSQVTDTPSPSFSINPRLSADGQTVAFVSSADIVPGQNPGGELRAFVFDVGTGQFAQVTGIPNAVREVQISDDASYLAVVEFVDFQSGHLWRVDVETLSGELIVTSIHNNASSPVAIDGTGSRLAFSSDEDLVPGQNPAGNLAVFVYDVFTDTILQISTTPMLNSDYPSLSRDGQRIAFGSSSSDDSVEPAVWVGEVVTGGVVPILSGGRGYFPALSADGQRVVFWGATDPTGGNPNLDSEIFLAECPELGLGDVTNIPTASGYGLACLAMLLAGGATFLLHRRHA